MCFTPYGSRHSEHCTPYCRDIYRWSICRGYIVSGVLYSGGSVSSVLYVQVALYQVCYMPVTVYQVCYMPVTVYQVCYMQVRRQAGKYSESVF